VSKGSRRRMGKNFEDNFDEIFGETKAEPGRYVYDKEQNKCVLKQESSDIGYHIQGDIEPFVSPIDKTVITGRAALRAHNKKHGVTDMRDYGPEWFERRGKEKNADRLGQTKAAKQERINLLKQAYERQR
jgi:hypothetical protein